MSPTVFLHETEVNRLFVQNGGQATEADGIAYGMDGDSVFHAYIPGPSVDQRGSRVSCKVVLLGSQNPLPQSSREAAKLVASRQSPPHLLVVLAAREGRLKGKAFFQRHNLAVECAISFIPEKSDLYSRSRGLLETDALAHKTVGIVGLGSGGSPIAIELAKAGVGGFVLIDFDRLELSNIARHVCGLADIGRFKTLAISDAIHQKNPYAAVNALQFNINDRLAECSEALSGVDLIVCASDNDRSRFALNEIALRHKITAIFGRALTRAVGGDVLRVRPYKGPCYSCLYSQDVRQEGGDDEEMSQLEQAKALLPDYTSEADLRAVIQVGLASDIAPISNLMVKLALVELSRGTQSGIKTLEDDLVADFYIWANRRDNVYSDWSKLEYNFNKPSILRWYGARVARDPNCMVCG
jgi:molybdopterin-synthase adenylyltransferase